MTGDRIGALCDSLLFLRKLPRTTRQLAEVSGVSHKAARNHCKSLHEAGHLYIAGYHREPGERGIAAKVYAFNPEPFERQDADPKGALP